MRAPRSRRAALLALAGVVGAAAVASPAAVAMPPGERQRIDRLIDHVALQRDIRFLRNGEAHEAAQAAAHLRSKLERAGDRVRGVDDFIEGVASRSWLSGQAYRVRLADGSETLARDWLRAQLRRLESAPAAR